MQRFKVFARKTTGLCIAITYLRSTRSISKWPIASAMRREKANSFFLVVNTALIALFTKDIFGSATVTPSVLELLVPVAAGVLCYLWYRIIRSYRNLNSAKFKIVHEIERYLPLCPYDAELEHVDRGKNPKLYLPFTYVEGVVPWLFMVFHGILATSALPWTTICAALRG